MKHGSAQDREWRLAVFTRDGFTCQGCGQVGGRLNADHIQPYGQFPELRFDLSNGRTLCLECHRKTPTFGWRGYWLESSPGPLKEIAAKRLSQEVLPLEMGA